MPVLRPVLMDKAGSTTSADDAKAFNTVFVDTSIDTHLVLITSDMETVSDLKRKILCEHLACFPNIGDIKIHSVKVKRRKRFYHLPDSVFVRSAFEGVDSGWFVFVDVSSVGKHIENGHPHNLDSPRRLTDTDDVPMNLLEGNHCVKSNLNVDQLVSDSLLGKRNAGDHGRVSVGSDNSSSSALRDESRNKINDVPDDSSLYSNSKAESFQKRKCKRRKKTGGALVDHVDKRNKDSVHASYGEEALQLVTMAPESNLCDDACRLARKEEVGDESKNDDIIQVACVTDIGTIPVLPIVAVEEKDLTGEPDTCFAPVQVSKGGMRSEPCPASPVVKHFDTIQETDLKDNEMEDIDAHRENNLSPSIDRNALADVVDRIVKGQSGLKNSEDNTAENIGVLGYDEIVMVNEQNGSGVVDAPEAYTEEVFHLRNIERVSSVDGSVDTGKSVKRKMKSEKQLDYIDGDAGSINERPTLGTVHASKELHIANVEGNSNAQVSIKNNIDDRNRSGFDQTPKADKEKDSSLSNEHKTSAGTAERAARPDGRVDTGKSVKRKTKSKNQLDFIVNHLESKKEEPTVGTMLASKEVHITNAEGNSELQVSIVSNTEERNRSGFGQTPKAGKVKDLSLSNEHKASDGAVEGVVGANGKVDTGKSVKRKTKSKKQLDHVDRDSESKNEKSLLKELHITNEEGNSDIQVSILNNNDKRNRPESDQSPKADKEKDMSLGNERIASDVVERVVSAVGRDTGKSVRRKMKSRKQLDHVDRDSESKNETPTVGMVHAPEELNITNEEGNSDIQVSFLNNNDERNRSGSNQSPVAVKEKDMSLDHEHKASDVERVGSADGRDTGKSVKRKMKSRKQLDYIDRDSESKNETPTVCTLNTENVERVEIAEGNVDPGKSVKKTKKSKKQLEPVIEHFTDLAAPAKAINGDHLKDNVEKEEAGGRSVKKTKKSKKQLEPVIGHFTDMATPAKAINDDHLKEDVEEEEADGRSVKRVKTSKKQLEPGFGSLAKAVNDDQLMEDVGKEEYYTAFQNVQQTDADQKNSDGTDKKLKKKSKKIKGVDTISIPELQTMDGNASHNNPALSDTIRKEDDDSFKLSNIPKSLDTPTVLNETNSGLKSNIMVGSGDTQLKSKVVRALDAHQGNNEDESPRVNEKSDPSLICTSNEPNSCTKVHNTERSQPEYEIDAVGETRVTNKIESNEKKCKVKRKKHDSHSDGPLHKPYENQNGAQAQVAAYLGTTQQLKTLPEDKSSNVLPDSIKEDPKSGIVAKKVTHPKKAERPPSKKASGTEESKEKIVASKSNFESSKGQHKQSNRGSNVSVERSSKDKVREILRSSHASRKVSGNKGTLVNKSESKKSLLAMSGSIFKDDYNENSEGEEEDGVHNSDTSTRTPSDASSDYSDEDSDANCSTRINGSYSSHEKQNGERNITALSSGPKNMSLHKILTSSSRYKKAKLTASQSQPEEDDIELVPDSQPV